MAKLVSWTNFKYNNFTPNVVVTLNTNFLQFSEITGNLKGNSAVNQSKCDGNEYPPVNCGSCASQCSQYGYPPITTPPDCPGSTESLIRTYAHAHGGDNCWCSTTEYNICGILQPTEICTIGTSGVGTCAHSVT